MSLHYLIDGYNVLYALPEMPAGTLEKKREALLRQLSDQMPFGKNQATVIFDSREGSGSQVRQGGITVAYTSGETADDWIVAHVREAANARLFVVVTDDQGLRHLLRGTGAKCLGTKDFWRQAKTSPTPPSRPDSDIDSDSITDELKKKWL